MSSKKISDKEDIELEKQEVSKSARPGAEKEDITAGESFSSAREEDIAGSAAAADIDLEKLKEQLARAEDKYLRQAAEFENYKKRNMRQFDEAVQSVEAEFFLQILEIFDNFKRALELPENQKSFESFRDGMRLIYEQMKKFLDKHKIEAIKAVGEKFNPDWHEAVMQIESDEHPEGTVASELGGGFKRGGKIIRHSKVGVSKGKSNK